MCCGKKIRTQDQPPATQRGLPPAPFQRTAPPSPPPLPRVTIGSPGVSRGFRGASPPAPFQRTASPSTPNAPEATIDAQDPPEGSQSSLSIRETNEVCPKCASKLGIQLRYSDRLRRHYEIKWCPTCKESK